MTPMVIGSRIINLDNVTVMNRNADGVQLQFRGGQPPTLTLSGADAAAAWDFCEAIYGRQVRDVAAGHDFKSKSDCVTETKSAFNAQERRA